MRLCEQQQDWQVPTIHCTQTTSGEYYIESLILYVKVPLVLSKLAVAFPCEIVIVKLMTCFLAICAY